MKARLLFAALIALTALTALAQETPVPLPTAIDAQAPATLPPAPDAQITPAPDASASTLGPEQIAALPILAAARADLDLLATQAIGSGQRPVGWTAANNPDDPDLPIKVRLDLELLAGLVWGEERPDTWFGVVGTVPIGIARDIRHDMELLADQVMGTATLRPAGWQGDNPIFRCGRATQAILTVLELDNLAIPVDFTQPDYCARAELDAAIYVERNILQPLRAGAITNSAGEAVFTYSAETEFVVAFLDRDARQKIGVLPVGTGFEVLGRSTVGFSNMMLIEGEGFRVYADWTTTSLTADAFDALPDFETVSGDVFCDADWCGVNVD